MIMSSVNKSKLYSDLLSAYTKAHSDTKTKRMIQDNVNSIWNNVKKNEDVTSLIDAEISKLNLNTIKLKRNWSSKNFGLIQVRNQ